MPTTPSTPRKAGPVSVTAEPASERKAGNTTKGNPLPGGAGVATGLALVTRGGRPSATAATVECLLVPGRGKVILTGNLIGSARDAAQVAVSLARARAARLGVDPALFLRADIHVHVMDPLPPKGGPSIGLPLFVALVSALTRRPVDKTFAFTGELSLTGAVLAVEGLALKAKAAARAGCARLYAPTENVGASKKTSGSSNRNAKRATGPGIVPVATVEDVLADVFGVTKR